MKELLLIMAICLGVLLLPLGLAILFNSWWHLLLYGLHVLLGWAIIVGITNMDTF